MTISSSPAVWDFLRCRTETTPETHEVLNRIRRGDPIAAILQDHPQLTQAQIGLARHLQNQELELNRLYSELQDVERLKMQVEDDLATSLLRALHQPSQAGLG
ncbi:MAG: DUF433 domain-containing protein [Cyanobacteria bacterium K_Offshore_surface_m2_011]|nr:DUF433 domain-containing protein [Cyanobacteria bacterium K_Offshore_surface_m2_011]